MEWAKTPDGSAPRFLHSPTSLAQLLREVGFVEAEAHQDRSRLDLPVAGLMDELEAEQKLKRIIMMFTAKK